MGCADTAGMRGYSCCGDGWSELEPGGYLAAPGVAVALCLSHKVPGCVQAVLAALKAGAHLRALLIALRLKDAPLLRDVVLATPVADVRTFFSHLKFFSRHSHARYVGFSLPSPAFTGI